MQCLPIELLLLFQNDLEELSIEKNLFNVESWLVHHGYKLEGRFLYKPTKP